MKRSDHAMNAAAVAADRASCMQPDGPAVVPDWKSNLTCSARNPVPILQQYCLQQLVQHRPADLLAVWSKFACPAPPAGTTFPDGRPAMHSALLPAAVRPTW